MRAFCLIVDGGPLISDIFYALLVGKYRFYYKEYIILLEQNRTHLWHYQYLIVISSDIVYCLKKVKKKKIIQMFFSLPFRFYQL